MTCPEHTIPAFGCLRCYPVISTTASTGMVVPDVWERIRQLEERVAFLERATKHTWKCR